MSLHIRGELPDGKVRQLARDGQVSSFCQLLLSLFDRTQLYVDYIDYFIHFELLLMFI